MLFQLTRSDLDARGFITLLVALATAYVVGIAFHEFSHALAAYLQGDNTAQMQGRLTLNPLAHLDPLGTMLLLVASFGWGKPTPVNPYRLSRGPRVGMALVAAAGPVSNFIMATLFALPIRLNIVHLIGFRPDSLWHITDYAGLLCFYVVFLNIVLGLFNLIPIAPLDGAKIAIGIFPGELGAFFKRMEPYGPPTLMVLFMLSFLSPQLSIFSRVLGPLEDKILRALLT